MPAQQKLGGALNRAPMSAIAATRPYCIPAPLRDLVMLDLLELTGSTTVTAEFLSMSQPSVSRRYRSVARELGLRRQGDAPLGRRYADTPWMPWLRKGVNHHRLAHGVLRVGGAPALESRLAEAPWAHWVRLGRQQQQRWRSLLTLELLDAVAMAEHPELSEEDTARLALLEVQSPQPEPVILICRRDPLVLAVCNRICGLAERP